MRKNEDFILDDDELDMIAANSQASSFARGQVKTITHIPKPRRVDDEDDEDEELLATSAAPIKKVYIPFKLSYAICL